MGRAARPRTPNSPLPHPSPTRFNYHSWAWMYLDNFECILADQEEMVGWEKVIYAKRVAEKHIEKMRRYV